jgi:Tol biopolymer transport system component
MKCKTKIGLILVAIMLTVVFNSGCIHEDVKDIKMLFPMSDTGEDICLTCDNENSPPNGLYKGAPEFHPDGEHVILQVEMEEHPFEDELGSPGAGWFNNIWMTTIDGDQWWQLTDYPHGEQDCYGVLIPKISHDGGKVAWAQLYKGDPEGQYYYKQGKIVPNTNPWGFWQLNIADLSIDGNDVCLENITSSRPGDGNFFEPQCWSPDDNKLLFAADIQKDHVHKLDIWMIDVETQELTQLTDTDDAWEEFASFSPDGKKISFMSSECCDWDPMSPESIPFESTLMTELYIMNSNGTEKVQITNINEKGLPGTEWDKYLQGRQIITENTWSSDGKKIFFGMVFSAKNGNPLGAAVWQLTFKDTYEKITHSKNAYALDDPCDCPINITVINEHGGRVSWSHSGNNLIAFDKRGADEYFDIYTMNPDGSNEICLAGDHPRLPGRHMGNPEWHPTGEYIIFQAEKKNHPDINSDLTAPGIGYYNDLWVMTNDGENVWQLTDLTTNHATSVLHPQFSHDGSRLLWSETLTHQVMALKIADFVIDGNGPHLENIIMYQPGDIPRFYESHGFSPDDKTIIFTASIETDMHWTGMDIYTMNLETMELERLTSTLDEWDEHAHYSPDGEKMVWMSSIGYPFDPGTIGDLRTDLWMMDADGSNKTRLTYFNEPGYPEYNGRQTVAGDCSWSPDGKKLVVKTQLYHGLKEDIQILIIEFVDDKPYLFIEKPTLGYSYVFDRELRQIKPDKCKIFGKITIEVNAYDENGIDRVEFFIDDVLKDTDTESPYEWTWKGFAIGKHTIKATVYDTNGNAASDDITVWRFF